MPKPISDVPHLDLDITAMRNRILVEQYNANREFHKRLADLDAVEAVLDREARAQIHDHGPHPRKSHKALPAMHGPYSEMTQRAAICDIVQAAPGITARAIMDQLYAGGYPFTGKHILHSVSQTIRTLMHTHALRAELPESRKNGEANRYFVGTIEVAPEDIIHELPARTPTTLKGMTMPEAIVQVLRDGPDEGLTRAEILKALHNGGYKFTRGKHPPQMKVAWAVHHHVKKGLLAIRDGKEMASAKIMLAK